MNSLGNVCRGGISDGLTRLKPFRNVMTVRSVSTKPIYEKHVNSKVSSEDLSNALKYRSKLKVTKQDLATLDDDIEVPDFKVKKQYTRDINKNVLTQEIKEAIRKERKDQNKPVSSASKPQRTNSKGTTKDIKLSEGVQKTEEESSNSNANSKSGTPFHIYSKHTDNIINKSVKKGSLEYNGVITPNSSVTQYTKLDTGNIARLAHNLDRTLFSPGVHFLQDPRTRIYNFTPYLKNIIKLEEFNFDAIEKFVSVSKDKTSLKIASETNKKFYSSTSSMTSTLSQFYYFLNNYDSASSERFDFPKFSTTVEKSASSVIVQPKGKNKNTNKTIYAVESDKSADTEILLSSMGHCLETLLTNDEEKFDKYRINYKNEATDNSQPKNVYNYSTFGNFLMRSQLDCYDDRLPGNGTFDLKTRAVCAIRYDSANPEMANNTYQIWRLNGNLESFEREFSDLIKTGALLKYAFQARIGQMDGIFVAYHNINSFFGFQYLPLSELDNIFYNHANNEKYKHMYLKKLEDVNDDLPSRVADSQFKMSLLAWESMMNVVIEDLGEDTAFRLVTKSVRHPTTRQHRLCVHAVPLDQNQVKKLQSFPSAFKTSFKEDLSKDERLENLNKHKDELNAFNKSTTGNGVLSYYMDVEHILGRHATASKQLHPYPKSKDQRWSLRYSIKRNNSGEQMYVDFLSASTDMIVTSFAKNFPSMPEDARKNNLTDEISFADGATVMEIYSAIGKARAKRWEEKDSNPIIYKPRTK